jgi:superfamily II DNA/RNA helicase
MRHLFWRVERTERVSRTAEVVSAEGRTVVFCRTRHGADRTASQLVRAGVAAAPIHGGRSQGQRRRALESFAAGRTHALVATDVAARGIHVDGVACVVHFDPPEDHKAYLHRSGRTARAGASGVVVSLVADSQLGDMKAMQRRLGLPMGFDGSTVATTEAELLTAAHTQSRHGSQGRTGNGAGRPSGSRRASSRRGARRGATAGRQGSGRRG